MEVTGIILAAGKGTRMKSDLPKCLHRVCGLPMVELVARALHGANVRKTIVVVGHGGDQLISALGDGYEFAWQREQHGTGHAVQMALPLLEAQQGPVVISPGDTPLLSSEIFQQLVDEHVRHGNDFTLAVSTLDDPTGYGRIVRDSAGVPQKIVEHKDATPEERAIREVNPALYVVSASILKEFLPALRNDNAQGEYYLTDLLSMCHAEGKRIGSVTFDDPNLLVGVNDRWQLAQASKVLRQAILRRHALNGVTIVDPDTTYIESDVVIGVDAVLEPGTILEGKTVIGHKSHIGPNTKIKNCQIGAECTILMSHLARAEVADHVRVGPFANIRPASVLGEGVKIGNFVEVKNAILAQSVSVSHLSYIGDGEVGEHTNIGAGTIFCNYDGYNKHRTIVGKNAFIGSNSTLVAPISIGNGAIIGAGSVLTKNVKADSLGLGRARQEEKEGWAASWRVRKASETSN